MSFLIYAVFLLLIEYSEEPMSGRSVTKEEVPWLGCLLYKMNYQLLCGTVLVSLRHMISSCSCIMVGHGEFAERVPEGLLAHAGDLSYGKDQGQKRNVVKLARDRRCYFDLSSGLWVGDIGYILVDLPFVEDKGPVPLKLHPTQIKFDVTFAKLALSPAVLAGNPTKWCLVVGWGFTKFEMLNGHEPHQSEGAKSALARALNRVLPAECQTRLCEENQKLCRFNVTKYNAYCFQASGDGRYSMCQGDLGGPLMCEKTVVGIASWSEHCGVNLTVNLFYKLDMEQIFDWIYYSFQPTVHPQDLNLYCFLSLIMFKFIV